MGLALSSILNDWSKRPRDDTVQSGNSKRRRLTTEYDDTEDNDDLNYRLDATNYNFRVERAAYKTQGDRTALCTFEYDENQIAVLMCTFGPSVDFDDWLSVNWCPETTRPELHTFSEIARSRFMDQLVGPSRVDIIDDPIEFSRPAYVVTATLYRLSEATNARIVQVPSLDEKTQMVIFIMRDDIYKHYMDEESNDATPEGPTDFDYYMAYLDAI